jgi:hypothetical protein
MERVEGVDDSEEAVVEFIHRETEDAGAGREGGVGDDGFDNAGVGDGVKSAVVERADDEVLGGWVVGKAFRVEVGRSEMDDVWGFG